VSPCFQSGNLTICYSPYQPALMYEDRIDLGAEKRPMIFRSTMQPFDFVWTDCCRKRRWAAYCNRLGGGWYDPQFFCAPGYGCRVKRALTGSHG
jgi:hypothetical protein